MNATATTVSDPAGVILSSLVATMVTTKLADADLIAAVATEAHPAFNLVTNRDRTHATKMLRRATTQVEAIVAIATAAKYLRTRITKHQAKATV